MGGIMVRLLLIIVSLLAVTGCSVKTQSSPISSVTWEGNVITKSFSTPYEKMIDDIMANVGKPLDEDAANFAKRTIDKNILANYGEILITDTSKCESKVDFIKIQNQHVINKLSRAISYNKILSFADSFPKTSNSIVSETQNNNTIKQYLKSEYVWSRPPFSVSEGYVAFNVSTEYRCDATGKVFFKMSIPSYEIQDPRHPDHGFKIAELAVDWGKVKDIMELAQKVYLFADKYDDYLKQVHYIAFTINNALSDRYKKEPTQTIKQNESLYKIPFEIMLSRVQRNFDTYKYHLDGTRLEFSEKVPVRNNSVDLKTIVRFFPEEGSKASVVFSLEYSPVYDKIAKKYIYDVDDANKYLAKQINMFDLIINKNR